MKTVRIGGIVRLANGVRKELARPVAPQRLMQLRKNVVIALRKIDELLAEEGVGPNALPAPSRKAYQFLSTIDFESIPRDESPSPSVRPPNSVTFSGMRSYLNKILDQLAQPDDQTQLQQVYDSICKSSINMEKQIQSKGYRPEELTTLSRNARGWLAYFSRQPAFEAYVAAVKTATPVFNMALERIGKFPTPVRIHFRPFKGIYRLRACQTMTLIHLPVPMICFSRDSFQALASLAVSKNRDQQVIYEAMLSEPYQEILADIEMLGGVTECAAGVYHDLAASFKRVNVEYFNGSLEQPHLAWSQTFTSRKLGHYDLMHDTVMISSSLDKKQVPAFVIDYIMYHELLHKQAGLKWTNNGRQIAHNAEFQDKKRRFRRYEEANVILNRFAMGSIYTQPV